MDGILGDRLGKLAAAFCVVLLLAMFLPVVTFNLVVVQSIRGLDVAGFWAFIALILGAGFSATALLSKVREFHGLMLLYACAAWMLMLRRLEITDLEAYLLGPSLILIGLGIFEAKMRGLLWPESITPNAKMTAGMAVFFAPVLILTLDLNHAWQVGIVFFAATAVIVASVISKLRVLLWGGLAAALAALMVTLAMVIPFSRMGFGWWIGLGSALLILTGVALERRVNGWLRSNVASARAKFLQAFTGWK